MLTMAIPDRNYGDSLVHSFSAYSPDGTNIYGTKVGSLRNGVSVGGWKLQNRVPIGRYVLPVLIVQPHFAAGCIV